MARRDHDDELLMPATGVRASGAVVLPRRRADEEINAAREALRLSDTRMHNLLESITDGFTILDQDWRISYINARAAAMLRPELSSGASLLGKNLWLEFPELRNGLLESQYRHAMKRQQSVGFELYYAAQKRWFEVRAHPSEEGLTSYIQDITQRKADETALLDSTDRLQIALAAGKLGDWSWDAASDQITLGQRAAAIIDVRDDTGVTWRGLRMRLVTEDRDAADAAFVHAIAARSEYNIECRIDCASGERRWLSIMGHANYDERGGLLGMTGMVQDVTARKAADDSLRRSEEELRALANSIPQLAWIARYDGDRIWYNERWYDYTGTRSEQLSGNGWESVYPPNCLASLRAHWEASLKSGTPFEMEVPIRGADGRFRWFLTRANPVRDSSGRVTRWFGTSTDVDQVKRAQEALRDESYVLEELNNTGTALASTRDIDTLLQKVTSAATRIGAARWGAFVYRPDDGDTITVQTRAGGDEPPFADPGLDVVLAKHPLGDGAVRIADLQAGDAPGLAAALAPLRSYLAAPVLSRSGEALGWLLLGHTSAGTFTERTERIIGSIAAQAAVAIDNTRMYAAAQRAAAEREVLLESERSARNVAERSSQMKDEFLATLSHELRTPLSAILGWAQVLRRGTRDEADLHRGLQTIERNARAQAQLIEDLLDMSRITSGQVLLETQAVSPGSMVDGALESVRAAAEAKNIALERDVDTTAGAIAGDPARLQQIFWNLLSNAIKFTPRDGSVRVSVRPAEAYVNIVVSDTGIGIKPEFLAYAFERFRQGDSSTTRKHGGLGLGLAIVKHLVEQHGGTVTVSSAGEGLGSSFTVQLPLACGHASAQRAGRESVQKIQTSELTLRDLSGLKVLVVDDEADARELVERIMSDCQAQVISASTAQQALQLLRSERPDILISDIGMPEVDGFELIGRVRALGRKHGGAIPAVALTAFARPEDRRRALESGFQAHISKPVEPSQLIVAVASLAAARAR